MRYYLLLTTTILLNTIVVYAQNATATDSTLAKIYTEKALFFKKTNLDSTFFYLKKAKKWAAYLHNLSELGRTSARQGNDTLACKYLQQAIEINLEKVPADIISLGKNYNYLGYIYVKKIKNLDSAKLNFEKTLLLSKNDNTEEENKLYYKNLGYAYKELGNIFHIKAQNGKAELYFNKGERAYKTAQHQEGVLNVFLDKANLYKNTSRAKKAEKLYTQVLNDPAITLKQQGIGSAGFADILHQKGQTQAALRYLDTAIQIFQQLRKKPELAAVYDTKSSMLTERKNWTEAEKYVQKAIELQDTAKLKNRDLGRQLTNLASIYEKQSKFEEALTTQQKALKAYLPDFKPIDDTKNPSWESLQVASSEPRIIESLATKAQIFWQKYQQTQQLTSLEKALETYTLTVQQIEIVKQSLSADESKNFIHNIFYPVYENALKAALKLYEIKKETKYLEKAFYFSEKNKATILLAAIKKMEAKQNADIPDSLLQKELKYKQKLAFLQFQQREAKATNAYTDSIFTYIQDLENVQAVMKKQAPTYQNYHKTIKTTTLAHLQTQLQKANKKTALIEYFTGDSTIYTFAITATEFIYSTTPKTAIFDTTLAQLQAFLNTAPPKKIDQQSHQQYTKNAHQQYTKNAHQLYQTLLEPILQAISDTAKLQKLIIIPDDKLAYLPFEALLTKPAKNSPKVSYRIEQLDYLLKKHIVTYASSATLWLESLNQKSDPDRPITHNYLAFSPKFSTHQDSLTKDCSNEDLKPLDPKNTITDICQLFGGQAYTNQNANKATFEQKSTEARILHLYTHACVSDSDPMESKIFFTDQPAFNYELYALQLNADLAVLTACETGTGELIRGEGIMSLSRAFLYAGCPSVITSLWKAQEKVAQAITKQFYQNLYDHQSKDEALHNAKIHYLKHQTSNHTSQPFYWGAFVHIGNPEPINIGKNNANYYYIFACFLLLIAIITSYQFFKKQK